MQEPATEGRHPAARDLDFLPTRELVRRLVSAERETLAAVEAAAPRIAAAVDRIAARLARGGRLFYAGAGTSGRLGALDAAECPPTFGSAPEQVQALLAGGPAALLRAVEGAEDDREAGAAAVRAASLGPNDALLAIAASGRTPFCLGALEAARAAGALGLALSCVADAPLAQAAELAIELPVGPELLSGSTRLKAGTATKIALNALSTGVMVRLGRTYGDLMVDVQASNRKLRGRALRLLATLSGLEGEAAAAALAAAGGELKTAVVAARLGLSPDQARQRLALHGGRLRPALGEHLQDGGILAFDAGGSRIRAAYGLARGGLPALAQGGPGNLRSEGLEATLARLLECAAWAQRTAPAVEDPFRSLAPGPDPTRPAAIVCCIAGASAGGEALEAALAARFGIPRERVWVLPDFEALLAQQVPVQGLGRVGLIAGTGSIAVAVDAAGRRWRAGGQGPGTAQGDPGSALWAVLWIAERLGWPLPADPSPAARAALLPAWLARLESEAPDAQRALLAGAAEALANLVRAAHRAAALPADFALLTSGGFLLSRPDLAAALQQQLRQDGLTPRLIPCPEPWRGALHIARSLTLPAVSGPTLAPGAVARPGPRPLPAEAVAAATDGVPRP